MARRRPRALAPASPRLRLLGAIVQARQARPPRGGCAALRSLPPRRARNSRLRSLPCSRLRRDLREAASRAAAAASSGRRRRHVFLPATWPRRRSRGLRSAPLPQMSQADRRLVLLQLPPRRGRLPVSCIFVFISFKIFKNFLLRLLFELWDI